MKSREVNFIKDSFFVAENYGVFKLNILQLRYFRNFLREPPSRVTWFNEPYDADSIMHYGTHQVRAKNFNNIHFDTFPVYQYVTLSKLQSGSG